MTDATETNVAKKDRSWLVWTGAVVGLLGLCIAAQVTLLVFAISEPSAAAEPDYYRKAVHWDEHRAQLAQNEALGWRLTVAPGELLPDQRRELRVALVDRAGHPLTGAQVRVHGFHKARRAQVLRATFSAAPRGGYVAALPLRRTGLYELRFEVTRGGERFTQVVERDLPGSVR